MMRRVFYQLMRKCGLVLAGFLIFTVSYALPQPEGIQVYQKNMHLSEAHKQKLAADIYRYYNADNIWDTLRHEFILPHYEYMPQVQQQINWFLAHPDFLRVSAERAAPYLYYILQQVHKRHLPAELVLLPIMESSYNPYAASNKGAVGIWQMMPGTATGFGVKQNWWYDGRRDVVASTRAALNYIAYLSSYFGGNWLLAIAAYDTGEGNILSAIKKNIREGRSTDYWSLPLSQETRDYIPRFLALAIIISHPDRYPISFPPVRNAPYLAQMDVGEHIDLRHAATLAGLSLKKLMQLNPGFNHGATDPMGPFKLVLPIEHVQKFSENLSRGKSKENILTPSPYLQPAPPKPQVLVDNNTINRALKNLQGRYALQPGDTLYMIRKGDDLVKIAQRFHLEVATLLAVNPLTSQTNLQPGEKIIIPTHLANINASTHYPATSEETIYMVRQGDDINRIAEQFHTTPSAIRVANLLSGNQLQIGDRLVIPRVG
jgi:membrane-bound lytic murein transglycosylase D